MNMKYSYHIHNYDMRHSHDLHVSDFTTFVYQNGIFNMDIKSYNKLPAKIKRLHSIIIKKVQIITLQNSFYAVEEYIQGAL